MLILLVEDDCGLGGAVNAYFTGQGHRIDWARNFADAHEMALSIDYDFALLDLGLPDGRGIDILTALRGSERFVPTIILTAFDHITERIAGLDAGADDYLVKPFDLLELQARMGAVTRRYAAKPHPERRLGPWRIDLPARRIIGPDGEITLTRQEWALLETFLLYPRKIHSRASLEEKLYSYGGEAESNTVEVYISRLRRKLGPETIVTQRGIGYRLGESLS